MEVVNSGKVVERYSGKQALVTVVEEATCSCRSGVGISGKALMELHGCLEVTNIGVAVVESCSSMVVVNTCGLVLDTCSPVEATDNC